MPTLKLWDAYERRAVHDIFAPETEFTPQAGSWGLWGIVKVPENPGDFVFFVTFGSTTGEHEFVEEINDDGVLTWQSQPRQRLTSPDIVTLIGHDDLRNTIHLFLRARAGDPYTYFGPLAYMDHDPTKEQPVHFSWQLLEWPVPEDVLKRSRLRIGPTSPAQHGRPLGPPQEGGLQQTEPPPARQPRGGSTPGLRKQVYLPDQDARNARLGRAGEELVVAHEVARLTKEGRSDLAAKVVHVAAVEGDGAGYDVRSYRSDGSLRMIEVKTTRGSKSSGFFISPNEVSVSEKHPAEFVLIRVFGFQKKPSRARFYELAGSVRDHFELASTEFRATIHKKRSGDDVGPGAT